MFELVGFAATIIGLAGVIYQLTMLRLDMRLTAERNVIHAERELWSKLVENPGIAPNLTRDYLALTSSSTPTESLFVTLLFGHYEMIHREYRNGVVSIKVWESMSAALISTLAVPSVAETWQAWKGHYDSEFVAYIDKEIAA